MRTPSGQGEEGDRFAVLTAPAAGAVGVFGLKGSGAASRLAGCIEGARVKAPGRRRPVGDDEAGNPRG